MEQNVKSVIGVTLLQHHSNSVSRESIEKLNHREMLTNSAHQFNEPYVRPLIA